LKSLVPSLTELKSSSAIDSEHRVIENACDLNIDLSTFTCVERPWERRL